MSIANYGELKTAIANSLQRSDLTTQLPDFIQYAESVVNGDPYTNDPEQLPGIRVRGQGKRVTTTVSTEYIDIPSDLLSVRELQLNTSPKTELTYLTPKVMTQKYPSALVGTPEYYTQHGDEFQFAPIPDGSFTLEISYNGKYTAFSDDTDTNWLLTNHPYAYVYAACVAGAAHTHDDASTWARLYKSIASGINLTERRGQYGSQLSARISTATP